MMDTPIYSFVQKYLNSGSIRFHMPGHKGRHFFCAEKFDITEIEGADELYNAQGIIKESEENATSLYGTAKTLYSTEGSSLSIRAMLYLVTVYAKSKGKKPLMLAARNVHSSFVSAAAMIDFNIEWLYPEENRSILSCDISGKYLDKKLSQMAEKPTALYITSPDYIGNIADIKGLSAVCRKYGTLLIVDNAHGAYLNFLPNPLHPIYLGADMCCDSAHKTLPVLTGGAYLHISKKAPRFLADNAKSAMYLFASTSPSYLVLQSLDFSNKYLCKNFKNDLFEFLPIINNLKESLANADYKLIGNEPLKISISAKKYGYYGTGLAKILKNKNIICEFADPDVLVLMLTPQNTGNDLKNLNKVLKEIEKKPAIQDALPQLPQTKKMCSPRYAVMSASKETDIDSSLGKTFTSCKIGCPPAVPILIPGEEINADAIKLFKYYGIEKCRILDID